MLPRKRWQNSIFHKFNTHLSLRPHWKWLSVSNSSKSGFQIIVAQKIFDNHIISIKTNWFFALIEIGISYLSSTQKILTANLNHELWFECRFEASTFCSEQRSCFYYVLKFEIVYSFLVEWIILSYSRIEEEWEFYWFRLWFRIE